MAIRKSEVVRRAVGALGLILVPLFIPAGSIAAINAPIYNPAGEDVDESCPRSSVGGAVLSADFSGIGKSERTLAYGRRSLISGRLIDAQGNDVPRATICIGERILTSRSEYAFAGTATTDEDGRWFFKVPSGPSRTISVSCWTEAAQLRTTLTLRVRAHATLRLSTHRTTPGHRVYFYGRISGPLPGKRVVFLAGTVPGAKRNYLVRHAKTDAFGHFRMAYAFSPLAFRAKFVFWVVVPAQDGYPYLLGRSANRYVRVSP
jgi:hypothetical protein